MKHPRSIRLQKAFMSFMGGGGSSTPPNPNITPELSNIYSGFKGQTLPAFHSFVKGEPLLSGAQGLALQDLQNLPQLLGQISPLISSQQGTYNQLQQILDTGGALTPEQNRDVTQATDAGFAARGNVMGNQALGSELLNRDQFRQQRFNTALGQSQGLSSSIAGLTQEQQGLQTGQLNQLTGVEQAETGSFATLVNPIYGLFENAQNAATQLQVANQNKSAGIGGGALGAIGSIAGAIGTAY